MVDAAVNAAIDVDVLGVLASALTTEIDWRAEYSRLYPAWKAAKNRLAVLEDKHRFASLAKELSEKCGRTIHVRCEFESGGHATFKAWIGYRYGDYAGSTTYTREFDTVEAMTEYVLDNYAIEREPATESTATELAAVG